MAALHEEKAVKHEPVSPEFGSQDGISEQHIGLHRRLNNRQIQLIAIGGAIGTAIFVSIGGGLTGGGAGSLLIAYLLLCGILIMVNNGLAEMTVHMPVEGGFVRLAGHWVDDALGFAAGWNFFFYEALLIPFEITALNIVMSFWGEKITDPGPTAAICAGVIILYAAINILAVKSYGEAEFWLSGGKVILVFIVFGFTLVTMCGGNPQGEAYGFSNWNSPGPFVESRSTGSKGKFEGFLLAMWNAVFTVVGPEYISMVSAESQRPRIYIKTAFKTFYARLAIFFLGSAICVGIVAKANDPMLVAIQSGSEGGGGTARASPYVIAMENLGIGVLPHIVNALLLTSIFSAGNTYTYCAMRGLYGLALEGRAPAILRKTNKNGIPVYAFFVVMVFPFLSFLQVNSGSAIVIDWLVSLITAGGVVTYIIMNITFICFYRACKAQGLDRRTLPYYGKFQPYCAIIALVFQVFVCIFIGYTAFGPPDVEVFFKNYTMQIVAPVLFIIWKVFKKTKWLKPHEVDLVWEAPAIDAYEASLTTPPDHFWQEMGRLIGIGRKRKSHTHHDA